MIFKVKDILVNIDFEITEDGSRYQKNSLPLNFQRSLHLFALVQARLEVFCISVVL